MGDTYGHRQTSGLMFSYFKPSQYHDNCIPSNKKVPVAETSNRNVKEAEFSKCNHVAQDSVWKQAVDTEKRCLKNWESSWGFLAEFDAQIKRGKNAGNEKEPEPLPENATVFSDDVPNTNAGNYGNRNATPIGQAMAKMEYQFYSGGRRKKLPADMICY